MVTIKHVIICAHPHNDVFEAFHSLLLIHMCASCRIPDKNAQIHIFSTCKCEFSGATPVFVCVKTATTSYFLVDFKGIGDYWAIWSCPVSSSLWLFVFVDLFYLLCLQHRSPGCWLRHHVGVDSEDRQRALRRRPQPCLLNYLQFTRCLSGSLCILTSTRRRWEDSEYSCATIRFRVLCARLLWPRTLPRLPKLEYQWAEGRCRIW